MRNNMSQGPFFGLGCAIILGNLVFWCVVIGVAIHFIHKFW